jgi:hypothetical protein
MSGMPNAQFPFRVGIFHPADEGGIKVRNRGGLAQIIPWRPSTQLSAPKNLPIRRCPGTPP